MRQPPLSANPFSKLLIKEFKLDQSGTLKVVIKMDLASVSLAMNTDLKIAQLLQRRGIALDIAKVMKFEDHDKIVQLLIEKLQCGQPSGFATLLVEQLQLADKEIWSLIGKETSKTGIQHKFEGRFPAEKAVQSVTDHPTVRMLLLPLPSSPPSSSKPSTLNESSNGSPLPAQAMPKQTSRKRMRSAQAQCGEGDEPPSIGGMAMTPDGSRI